MTRSVALCADDFGLGAGISAGIVDLAQRGRLSAVSCLAGASAWRDSCLTSISTGLRA